MHTVALYTERFQVAEPVEQLPVDFSGHVVFTKVQCVDEACSAFLHVFPLAAEFWFEPVMGPLPLLATIRVVQFLQSVILESVAFSEKLRLGYLRGFLAKDFGHEL